MTKKRIVTTVLLVAILGTLIYFQVQHWRSFDWARFRHASHVDPLHIIAAIALIYATYVLRALRWKVFLEPVRRTTTARLIGPTFIGFTGLALLGRPGEFIRPYLIAAKEDVSFPSQIGAWTVERIFDIGAFTVLMTLDVFLSSRIQGNPYLGKFRLAALALCGLVAFMTFMAIAIRKRGGVVAGFLHRLFSGFSAKLAHHVDQKVRAFGEGLNTVADGKALAKLIVISLVMWFTIALAYREVAHSYPPEASVQSGQEQGPPSLDVETAKLADLPELAGQPLTPETIVSLNTSLNPKGFAVKEREGDFWLMQKKKAIKKVGDRPHLSNMSIPHVLLLMGFSMIGSVVQLPAVGGGSQLAVISALQVVYGIPPELAVSCGMLLWLVTFMACIPVGLILAHREHLSLRKLSAESHAAPSAEPEPAPVPPAG